MKNIHKNKSRTRLYDKISGVNSLVGAAGQGAVGSIQLANIPVAGEKVELNGTYFQFQAAASEAAGTSAGTSADPHLVTYGANVAAAVSALATQMLAETATTGAWGFFYPDDSVGCASDGVDTVDFVFWPGTEANSYTLTGTAGDETIVTPAGGVVAKYISADHKYNFIDTTGSAATKELYVLEDGDSLGDTVNVFIKTAETTDTPTVVGHLAEGETAMVEALFTDAAGGKSLELLWDGTNWVNTNENGTITFTASA